jgi:hypothetical protein
VPQQNNLSVSPLELTKSVRDISVTERNSFKSCRRQWLLETIENLEPRGGFKWAFEFGTGIHTGLEAYYKAKGHLLDWDADPKEEMLLAFNEWYEETDKRITEAGLGAFESEVRNELVEYKDLGEIMLWNYHEFAEITDDFVVCCVEGQWTEEGLKLLKDTRPPYAKHLHPILHESGRFLVPIIDPGTGEWLEGEPYMSARLDLVVYKKRTGVRGFWVEDHKTASQAPSDKGLEFDDQVTGYGYTLWRHTGIYPRGTEFNELIKKAPSAPRILQNGTLSTAKDQLTLPILYMEEMKNQGLVEGKKITSQKHLECYESLRAHGWDRFFKRMPSPRNENEYKMFELRLPEEYKDMLAVVADPARKAYPHLSQYNCPGCSVAPICQAIEDGSDYEFVIESRFQQAEDRKAK